MKATKTTSSSERCGSTKSDKKDPVVVVDPYVQSMTDPEKAAVKELRRRLAKTHPELPTDDPFKLKKCPVVSRIDTSTATLLRFIRARKNDVAQSELMIHRAIVFRKRLNLKAILKNTTIHPIIPRFRPGGRPIWGRDREGAVIFYDRGGRIDPTLPEMIGVEDSFLWELKQMELTLREMHDASTASRPQRTIVVVQDLQGFGFRHVRSTALRTMVQQLSFVMDTNYPELLKRCIVINAPRIFSIFWNIVKYFFSAATREKVIISSSQNPVKILSKYIDPANIPAYITGGKHVEGSDPECAAVIRPGGNIPDTLSPKMIADIDAYEKIKKSGALNYFPKDFEDWTDSKKIASASGCP